MKPKVINLAIFGQQLRQLLPEEYQNVRLDLCKETGNIRIAYAYRREYSIVLSAEEVFDLQWPAIEARLKDFVRVLEKDKEEK